MPLSLQNLKSAKHKERKRIGRGGKRGTYSGRGQKGQRARSGGKRGLKRLGLKLLMSQTHKLRGFKSIGHKPAIVSLDKLNAVYQDGEEVSPKTLLQKGLIRTARHGVKILMKGRLDKKVTVIGCLLSAGVSAQLGSKAKVNKTAAR